MNKFILVLLLAFSGAAVADPWLCIADKSTGFTFEKGKWITSGFIADGKYIVRKNKIGDFTSNEYGVYQTGETFEYHCGQPNVSNQFLCTAFHGEFRFSIKTGRYLKTSIYAYYLGINDDDTPYMEIGRCSEF